MSDLGICRGCTHWRSFLQLEIESDRAFREPRQANIDKYPHAYPTSEERIDFGLELEAGQIQRKTGGDILPNPREWGVCSRERESGSLYYTQDASDYASSLHTEANFGCVLWEPRSDAE